MEKLKLEHLAGYLPYGLKYNLPLESERYESIMENEPFRLALPFMNDKDKSRHFEVYKKMYLYQKNPQIMFDDNELFLGQMESSLGFEEDDVYLSEVKPILRPLSDITKEEWSSIFVNNDIDNILSCYQSDKHLGCVEYYIINILLKHHFDIHGLIDKNLAIDINTL